MPTLGEGMSGSSIADISKTWDLQRAYQWKLIMPFDFGGVNGVVVSEFCQDIDFGDYRMSDISSMKYGAFRRFYAGILTIDAITLLFLYPTNNYVKDYFYGWRYKVVDERGYYHPKREYKRDIFTILYDSAEKETIRFKLQGTFPTTLPKIHPSYREDGTLEARVTLSVDSIEPQSMQG